MQCEPDYRSRKFEWVSFLSGIGADYSLTDSALTFMTTLFMGLSRTSVFEWMMCTDIRSAFKLVPVSSKPGTYLVAVHKFVLGGEAVSAYKSDTTCDKSDFKKKCTDLPDEYALLVKCECRCSVPLSR